VRGAIRAPDLGARAAGGPAALQPAPLENRQHPPGRRVAVQTEPARDPTRGQVAGHHQVLQASRRILSNYDNFTLMA